MFTIYYGLREISALSLQGHCMDLSKEIRKVYISLHQIVLSYNQGSGMKKVVSTSTFRDDMWHNTVVQREGERASIYADGSLEVEIIDFGENDRSNQYQVSYANVYFVLQYVITVRT